MTLKDLRANAGLSYNQVLARLQEIAPEVASETRNGVVQLERRGTENASMIRALSTIYGVSFEEVEAAAKATRTQARATGILSAPRSKIKLPRVATSA